MTKARDLADRTAADITAVTAGTGISISSGAGPIPTVTNTVATGFDAKGDLIVGTGADTFSKLTVASTAGHVLTVDSAETTGLKWAAPSSGALTKIAKTAFSGATSASFNDVFSSTYVNYRILIQLDSTSGNNQPIYFRLRVSGSDAATNYTAATSYNDGGDIPYAYRNLGGTTNFRLPEIDNDYSNEYYSAIDLFCPQLARKTGYLSNTYSTTLNGQPKYEFTAGTHTSATSYTGFSLVSATGNIAGTVWIYGYQD